MTKQEFLTELKEALLGEVSPEAMMDSYRYYDSYIDEYVRKGKREEEVVEMLGKPALIARSIIAAQTGERVADVEFEDGRERKVRRKEREHTFSGGQEQSFDHKEFQFEIGAWYAKILYVFIFLLLLVLAFCILKGVIWIFFTFGIPILIVLGIVYLILYFTGRR